MGTEAPGGSGLRDRILELDRRIVADQRRLSEAAEIFAHNIPHGKLPADQADYVKDEIVRLGEALRDYANRLLTLADDVPVRARALLYRASTKLVNGNQAVSQELCEAAANIESEGNGQHPPQTSTSSDSPVTEAAAIPKRPCKRAWQAHFIRVLRSTTNQADIAKAMVNEGVKATQGQVSKWLKEIDAYVALGLKVPTPEELKAIPMDPAKLEMGRRLDGLTPRQRDRAAEMDDYDS